MVLQKDRGLNVLFSSIAGFSKDWLVVFSKNWKLVAFHRVGIAKKDLDLDFIVFQKDTDSKRVFRKDELWFSKGDWIGIIMLFYRVAVFSKGWIRIRRIVFKLGLFGFSKGLDKTVGFFIGY